MLDFKKINPEEKNLLLFSYPPPKFKCNVNFDERLNDWYNPNIKGYFISKDRYIIDNLLDHDAIIFISDDFKSTFYHELTHCLDFKLKYFYDFDKDYKKQPQEIRANIVQIFNLILDEINNITLHIYTYNLYLKLVLTKLFFLFLHHYMHAMQS